MEWAREGIVEALKARYWLYRQILRYFLWMRRLSGRAQWGMVLGLLLVQNMLPSLPGALAPLGNILFWCLIAFVFFTWTADPIFNLLLRLNRLGRLALSREQTWASNCVGACFLFALAALAAWALSGDGRFCLAALMAGWLVIPVAGTFKCRSGRPRLLMVLYTVLLAVLGAGGLGIFFGGGYLPRSYWELALQTAKSLCLAFFVGAAASTWLVNLLRFARFRG